MKIWKDEEVKSLFGEVEKCKKEKKSLKQAFVSHAGKFHRKPNSVRNYYYHEVDNLLQDKERCRRLEIDLKNHEKSHFENFDKIQEEELFEKIENLVKKGHSVRSACREISGGDLSLMTRIQNKFQNMKRKVVKKDNIIPFQNKQKVLTENDINSLFLGLVKLIKKTALEEAKQNFMPSNELLKKAFADLSKKDMQIDELKANLQRLKIENKMLRRELEGDKTSALERHLSHSRAISESGKKEESKRV